MYPKKYALMNELANSSLYVHLAVKMRYFNCQKYCQR